MHPSAIGPFQIEREIGRGGMGEVFLARDTRLERPVAIKALPAHLAADADRLARFQREAKVLASLNHPGIGAIYGLEESGGHQYLVLEFIEGQTLEARLRDGAIPVDEALSIAKQVAEALEAAHEKGVIHRDLKPGNVMVTPEGVVKVLDFGLARTAEGSPSTTHAPAAGSPESPTAAAPIHSPTIPGAIMGTAGYMSPEQARGKPVDKRSDIFSFGCVLFEMLAGSGPFPGETVTDSLGAILHREPEWGLIPPRTPTRVRELLRSCLAKDRRNRLHDIGDARLEIERAVAGHDWTATAAPAQPARSHWPVSAGLACAAAVLAGAAGWVLSGRVSGRAGVTPPQSFHVAATIPDKPTFSSLMAISPDAKFLVYTASPELPPDSVKPEGLLMVRRLDRDETAVIEGTEGAMHAALSPDGRWIAFACASDRSRSRLSLKRIALENGRPSSKPEIVCEISQGAWPRCSWASDREILFTSESQLTIHAVAAAGGEPRVVLGEDLPTGIEGWDDFRPLVMGRSILATRVSLAGQKIKVNTEVIELATGKRTLVLPDAGSAQYVTGRAGGRERGYLVAMRPTRTSLVAVPFDLGTLRTAGEPVTVWSGNELNSSFCLSPSGTLAMSTQSLDISDRRVAWIDERGQPQPIPGMTRAFGEIAVSPDGGRVLVTLDSPGQAELMSELWVYDLARRAYSRIPNHGLIIGTIWSVDGQQIAYGLVRDGAFSIWERPSDGSGEPVKLHSSPDSRTYLWPSGWSPDGRVLAFGQGDIATDNSDAYLLEQDPASSKWVAKPYLKSPLSEVLAGFSPDGKWALVGSNQSGRHGWYVQPFSGDGDADAKAGRVQVSTGGAGSAWWNPDGKELRYLDADKQVVSVGLKTEPKLSVSDPTVLYSIGDLKTRSTTFAHDGRLMVVLKGDSERTTKKVDVVVNFLEELRARMAAVK